MHYFRYKRIEVTGVVSSGVMRLPYQEAASAAAHLERSGATTVYVRRLGPVLSFLMDVATFRLRKKLDRTFQAEFLNNLSMMLHSGMTLNAGLGEVGLMSGRPDFEEDLRDLVTNIQGGATFSQAAEKYGYIFPKTVIHLIRLGEETGKLDRTLKDASEHLKRIQTIVSDTKQALLYPMFVFLALAAGLLFWLYYVVPKIVVLFEEMDVTLPTLTRIILRVSGFVQEHLWTIGLGGSLSIAFLVALYRKQRRFRKAVDGVLLKLPVAQSVLSASNLAFVSEYFSLLINVGIDILRSMEILREAIGNEVYRENLEEVKQGLLRGEGISESFRKVPIFPSFVVRMISVGEQSGTLPEQLAYIAEEYRKKLSILVATLGKMIEPIMLIVAGAMFAIIAAGLFLPIYDLISRISGR